MFHKNIISKFDCITDPKYRTCFVNKPPFPGCVLLLKLSWYRNSIGLNYFS